MYRKINSTKYIKFHKAIYKGKNVTELDLEIIIKHIRHALAHGNIDVDDDQVFTFTSHNLAQKPKGAELQISFKHPELDHLTRTIGKWFLFQDNVFK